MNEPVRLRVWFLVGVLFLLHFFLHVGLSFGRGAPDLLTVALLIAAREAGMARAAVAGFAFGLLEDALSTVAFGANTVAMTVVAVGGAFTRDLFVGDSRLFVVLYFFVGTWVRNALHWASVGGSLRQPFVGEVLVQGSIASAYAAVVGLVVVSVVGLSGESA